VVSNSQQKIQYWDANWKSNSKTKLEVELVTKVEFALVSELEIQLEPELEILHDAVLIRFLNTYELP